MTTINRGSYCPGWPVSAPVETSKCETHQGARCSTCTSHYVCMCICYMHNALYGTTTSRGDPNRITSTDITNQINRKVCISPIHQNKR